MYRKTLIVRETKRGEIVMSIQVETSNGKQAAREIARFQPIGLGYCASGAAGRAMINMAMPDDLVFKGTPETYKMLVSLGVIEPKDEAA